MKVSWNWIANVWAIKRYVTSPITMGCMHPNCFSNVKNQDVENKCEIKGGTWPRAMCPHIFFKGSNHSHNHLGQISIVKVYTPYLKGH
jgi:hypothetical protein